MSFTSSTTLRHLFAAIVCAIAFELIPATAAQTAKEPITLEPPTGSDLQLQMTGRDGRALSPPPKNFRRMGEERAGVTGDQHNREVRMQATSNGFCASIPRSSRNDSAEANTRRDSEPRVVKEQAQWRGALFAWISSGYLGSIWGLPTVGILGLMRLPNSYKFVVALLGPILWSILFVTIAGALSILHQ